jgi:parallel beta-helix repeat protein
VKFDAATALYIGYYSAAILNAVGTSGSPITFTSSASTPAPADWYGIVFFNSTDDASTIMDYCTVEYGGLGGYNSNINCNDASPTIQNCTIRHSDGYGIYCDNQSAPTLTNNTISNNSVYPISLYCGILDSNVTGNTGSGNGTNAIQVRDGSIITSRTWVPQDFYFNVTGAIHVYSGATLTTNPGCLVKFNAGGALYIGYYSAAILNAVGTSGNPITFTSNASTPAPADWHGIVFFNSTDDASTIMDYCTVEYGGLGGYDSNIFCDNASPTIQNCTIRHSDGYGIYCDNYAGPTLTNNTINNNGLFPIAEFCNMLDSNVTGNTGSGNGTDAIEVRGGSMTDSHTWVPQDFYFFVNDWTHVYNSATLTLQPGCLVKFYPGRGLYFGYYGEATLIAEGTSSKPITFTSHATTPAPGDWEGIVFFNSTDDASTVMKYCTVEYGGYTSILTY